jgi:broad specificity phosphatase PhoE
MGFIFVLRHCPTIEDHDESVDGRFLEDFAPRIAHFINQICHIDIIYTSPLKRCTKTAIAIEKYIHSGKVLQTEQLNRWNSHGYETRRLANIRAYNFGYSLYSQIHNSNRNVLIITHSSILGTVVQGISGLNMDIMHIYDISLSLYDANHNKLIFYNKDIRYYY